MAKTGKAWNLFLDVLADIFGCAFYAAGIYVFTAPNNIAPGGASGIATLVNYLSGFPIGTMTLIINIPLVVLSFIFLGKKFTLKTLITVIWFTLMLDYGITFLPVYQGNTLLAALYGGVMIGLGQALVYMRGSTTGGTDIVAKLLQLKIPHISSGKLFFGVNTLVILAAALIYQNIEAALYALIAIFATSNLMDAILYGLNKGKMVMVVTQNQSEMISKEVIRRIGRGATLLDAQGAYSGDPKKIIMVAMRNQEFYKLKKLVSEIDPEAFLIVMDAGQVFGKGFYSMK